MQHARAIDEATGQLQDSATLLDTCYTLLKDAHTAHSASVGDALRAAQLLMQAVVGGVPWDTGLGAFVDLPPAARLGALVGAGVHGGALRELLVRLFEDDEQRDEALQVWGLLRRVVGC